MKRIILTFLCFILAVPPLMAEEGYRRKDWRVETRVGKVFYLTDGTGNKGHEFGFFKDLEGCEEDVFWLSLTSSNEEVKNFQGQGARVSLSVGGKDFVLRPTMLSVLKMNSNYVMMFTNWVPSEAVIKALRKGRSVTVTITDPPRLEVLLDIKEEKFSLMGFSVTRRKAASICKKKIKELAP